MASKKSPYDFNNDPYGDARGQNPLQRPQPVKGPATLKQKQKQSIVDEGTQSDPVGDFVRRIIGGNKAKKNSG